MAAGKVEVDSGLFQIAVTQQHLDGAQVRTGFEKMSGKAVAKRVRVYTFMKTRA